MEPSETSKKSQRREKKWTGSRVLQLLVLAAPAVLIAYQIWGQRWIADDGFINFRIVQNLLDGHGPLFNVGERVEAYTSSLWMGVLALAGGLGLRLEYAAVAGGLLGTAAGVFLAALGAWTVARGHDSNGQTALFGVPLGAAIYAVIPPAWDFGTSGLEMGMSIFWLGLVYFLMARLWLSGDPSDDRKVRSWYAVAVVLGLGPLIRPELALFSLGLLLPLLIGYFRRRGERLSIAGLLKIGLAMGAIPVVYELFRMGYFAALVPNTALAKSAFGANWEQGTEYFSNFFGFYELLYPLLIATIFWLSAVTAAATRTDWMRTTLLAVPFLVGAGYIYFVVRIGGGYMHGRLFLPALFGLLLPVAAVPLWERAYPLPVRVARLGALMAAAVWVYYCGTGIRMDRDHDGYIFNDRRWFAGQSDETHPVTLEDYETHFFHEEATRLANLGAMYCPEKELPPPQLAPNGCQPKLYVDNPGDLKLVDRPRVFELREVVASRGIVFAALRTAIGLKGVVLGPSVHVVDNYGLADPFSARLEIGERGRPGHERSYSYPWLVGRFAVPELGEDPEVSAARRAMNCGDLLRLRRAVSGPLTVGQFFRNFYNAFRLHSLKIPRDPVLAERRFCGHSPYEKAPSVEGGSGGGPTRALCPVGYVLVGFDTSADDESKALAHLRPRCRRLHAVEEGGSMGAGVYVGNRVGGRPTNERGDVDCREGQPVTGLRGVAGEFVQQLRPICGTDTGTARRPTVDAGGDGEDFRLRCPDGEIARGLAARSGALIDAVGLFCARPDEIAGAEPVALTEF